MAASVTWFEGLGPSVKSLTENVRQVDEGDRTRARQVRDGQTEAAIDSARAAGRWHSATTADGVRSLLLQKWPADPGVASRDKLIIANTVAEVEWFNEAARELLLADGALGPQALTVERIRSEHAAGGAWSAARQLNADGMPTANGGRRWYPATVRYVICGAGQMA